MCIRDSIYAKAEDNAGTVSDAIFADFMFEQTEPDGYKRQDVRLDDDYIRLDCMASLGMLAVNVMMRCV